ncbi:glutaredoxin 3 [Wolbachia pipientis]|uniref:Glutaredoxin n=1 Tax=Wolbachia pipientis TaxID=955 RepID=A0A6C1U6B7_WOLPI|nr:glutaredoxin 3 [Wolbachia pipientis]
MKNVVIYVKKGCPYCIRAKDLLDRKGVEYEEIDVLKNSDLFKDIKSKYNVRTVPQIFINDKHIAGCDKLMDLEKEGKLDNMLNNNEDSINATAYTSNNDTYEEGVVLHDDFM